LRQITPPPDSEAGKHEQAILALLRSPSKVLAAEACGVSLRTIFRYLADPEFMAKYRATRRAAFDDALRVLEANAEEAAQCLVNEMHGRGGAGVKRSVLFITAATRVLDRAIKAKGTIAVEEELARVRRLMDRLKTEQPVTVIYGPPSLEEIHTAKD
jgi:hypothetical protein